MVVSQNQNVVSGNNNGSIVAASMPNFTPQTTFSEVSPQTTMNLDVINLSNVLNSQVLS